MQSDRYIDGISFSAILTFFISLGFVTLSCGIFFIFNNYPVTLASLVVAAYCLFAANHLQRYRLVAYALLLCFFVGNAIINVSWLNELEFLKSFMLTAVMLFVYITSLDPNRKLRNLVDYEKILKIVVFAILGFQILQMCEQVFFGSTTSWFWLDGISISTAEDIGRFEAVNSVGIFRPVSFYHEPSYLAVVVFLLLLIHDRLFCSGYIRYILIGSIILTLSSSILSVLSIYIFAGLVWRKKLNFMMLTVVFGIVFYIGFDKIWEFFRLSELSMQGTSGYIRIVEPFIETRDLLERFPFGIPLGQSPVVFNNSIFLIPLYFGMLTPIVLFVWLSSVLKKIEQWKQAFYYFLGVFALLVVSGAFFTLESAFLLLMFNYAFMYNPSHD